LYIYRIKYAQFKSGSRPGVGNDRTGAQLPQHSVIFVAELEPSSMKLPFSELQNFPCRTAPQWRPVRTPTATYVAHFLQANFELHPYDVEK
jgi:hypothetical protein